jgi:hypothetical protein
VKFSSGRKAEGVEVGAERGADEMGIVLLGGYGAVAIEFPFDGPPVSSFAEIAVDFSCGL